MYKIKRTGLFRLLICLFITISVIIPIPTYPERSINDINKSTEIHTSSSYEYEWFATYGGEMVDKGYGVNIDSLNNIYVTGFQDGGGPLCLLKYNYNGSLLWNKTWGHGRGQDIAIHDLNSIYVTGYYDYNGTGQIGLLKYNSSGYVQMNKTWGETNFAMGYGIDVDNIGNIYITGFSGSYEGADDILVFLKYGSSGDLIWNKTLDIHSSGDDVTVDNIGNVYITGYKQNGLNNKDLCLLKYNSSGILEWEQLWGGSGDERGKGIVIDKFGALFITGYSNNKLCILSSNNTGELRWVKTWGDEDCLGNDIKIDGVGNIYITGRYDGDILLVKFDKNGNLLGFKTWYKGSPIGSGIVLDMIGNAYITGTAWVRIDSVDHFTDIFLLKYDLKNLPINNIESSVSGYHLIILIIGIGIISVVLTLIRRDKLNYY